MELREKAFYQKCIDLYRGTAKQFGWRTREGQMLRFDVILQVMNDLCGNEWKSCDVLDFGCGTGDLEWVLRGRDYVGKYTGIDGMKENIDDAENMIRDRGETLGAGSEFVHKWWDVGDDVSADIVLASGTFGITASSARSRLFGGLLKAARKGVVMNFLKESKLVKYYDPDSVTAKIDEMLGLIDQDVFRVIVRADYMAHDFTIGAIRWAESE